MGTHYSAFWLPRRGNQPEEYEDAFAADAAAGRFAVADGASESGFAGPWARLLAEAFVGQPRLEPDHWTDALSALQQQWQTAVGSRPLPWYAKAKFRQGAFATFLGVTLGAAADGAPQWRAVAVGDTCLFHSRGATLLKAFPLEQSSQFNNYPRLVGSRALPDHVRQKLSLYARCGGQPDDRLWLMTDALAQWCLAEHEAGQNPWDELESLRAAAEPEQRFAVWIAALREAGRLHNDDVTLLAVNL